MTSHSIILNVTLLLTINSVISAQRLSCVSLNGYGQCYNYKERDFDLCLSCKIENTNLLKGGAVTIPNYSLRSNVKQIYFEGGTVDFLPMTEISMAFPNLHCLYFNGTSTKTISDGFFQNISRKDLKEFRFEFSKTSVEIDANAFRSVKNLHMVLISNNNDLSIDSLAFSGLIYLKELDLNSNKLEIVQQLWFTDLRELEHLFVAKNKIRKLENGVFMNLRKLKVLSLHTNKLKFLQFSLFASNTNLKELYLQSNQIMEIQAGTFLKLTQLIELSLLGNICVDQTFEDLPAVEIEKELKECTSSKQNEKPKESSIEEEVDCKNSF